MGISGTPSFIMGDEVVRGYVPREELEKMAASIRKDG
jgi:protein-disulfide isomerase